MAQFTKDIPDKDRWAQSIGGLIINFGCLEFQSLRWIHVFGGENEVTKVRGSKLSKRIAIALELSSKSDLTSSDKKDAQELWTEARILSKIRNQIAHNPLAQGFDVDTNEAFFSVIDLKRMTPNGPNQLKPLLHEEIAESALRAGWLNNKLSSIIEKYRNSLNGPIT